MMKPQQAIKWNILQYAENFSLKVEPQMLFSPAVYQEGTSLSLEEKIS